MKKWTCAVILCVAPLFASAQSKTKCESNINGFKIKTVYITGNHYNGVIWAYKHIAEATCLTPVTDPTKADAILEVIPNTSAPTPQDGPLTVSCTSSGASSSCIDSEGNELSIDCYKGVCSSYYGPSPAYEMLHALGEWVRNAWYQSEVRIYTPDHKLVWKSEHLKGDHWYDMWPDKIRERLANLNCSAPAGKGTGEKFRNWASEKCGIEFDPLVSIDIKARDRAAEKQAIIDQKQSESDEMKRNAAEAAAKQRDSLTAPPVSNQ